MKKNVQKQDNSIYLKSDLHIHTLCSDGINKPSEYILKAIKSGINVISITDHNTFKGSIEAIKFINSKKLNNLVIIPGSEVRTEIGDILVYCPYVPENETPRDFHYLIDWCFERDCILVPAHPLDIFRKGIGIRNLITFRRYWKLIEVYNAGSTLVIDNLICYKISKKLNIPGIASSDAHSVFEMKPLTIIINKFSTLDLEYIYKCLKDGNVTVNVSISLMFENWFLKIEYKCRRLFMRF